MADEIFLKTRFWSCGLGSAKPIEDENNKAKIKEENENENRKSKSRLNFLEILRGKHTDYCIDEYGIEYLKAHKFSEEKRILLKRLIGKGYANQEDYMQTLRAFGIREEHHLRLAREAGLYGKH